jgi:hypothetical protein
MDVSWVNWAYFALAISGLLVLGWIVRAGGRRPSAMAVIVGLALLVLAGFNAAAPWRGLLDPEYVGYGFGYLHAERGWPVTTLAGGTFALAATGAFAALETGRRARAFTALVCLLFAINVGGPWLESALTDPAGNVIQFGEYLTIPGAVGTGLLFVLFVLPFAAGAVWAGRLSLRG